MWRPRGGAVAPAVAAAVIAAGWAAGPAGAEVRWVEPPAARDRPESPPREVGLALLAAGRYAEAAPPLAEALAARPGDPAVLKGLGIALVETRRDAEAVPVLERARAARPDDLDVRAYLGVAAYHLARYEEAVRMLGEVVAADSAHRVAASYLPLARRFLAGRMADSWIAAAEAAQARGAYDDAARLLAEALEIEPGNARATERLASLRARTERAEIERWGAALEATFDAVIAESFVAAGLDLLGSAPDPVLASRVAGAAARLAATDLAAGRPGEALERLAALAPIRGLLGSTDRARLAMIRGRALVALGRPAEALDSLDEAARLDPSLPLRAERLLLGARRRWWVWALGAAGGAALTVVAARRGRGWWEAGRRRWRLAAAKRAEEVGDWAVAAEHLEAYLSAVPADAGVAARLAEALRRSGARARAVEVYRRAIGLDPKRAALRRALAETLAALDRRAEAFEAWRDLVTAGPPAERAAAALEAARLAADLQRPAEAADLYGAAFAAGAPRGVETLRAAARALAAAGRADEANALLKEILRASPAAVGDVLKEYRQIFRTEPGEREIHILLARHYHDAGGLRRAAAEFEMAGALGEAVEAWRLAGDSGRTVEIARRAAAAEPDARAPRHALVRALLWAGQPEEAATAAREAVLGDRDDLEAFRLALEVARGLHTAGRRAAARALLEAIEGATAFDATEARFLLGAILAEEGEPDRAIETVQRIEKGGAAIETRAKTFIASQYLAKGAADVSLEILSTLDLDRPGVTMEMRKESRYWRGRAAEATGDLEGAVRAYDAILQVDIRHRDVQKRREDLIRALAAGRAAEGGGTACPRCGVTNRADRKFCSDCGAPLSSGCPACGATNEPSAKFCGACGAPLGAGPS